MTKQHDFHQYLDRTQVDSAKWHREFPNTPYPMGVADMDFTTAAEIKQALHQRIDGGTLGYSGSAALTEMIASIRGFYQRHHDFAIPAEQIISTPGLMVAFNLILETFASPGDQVILQTPVYHSFARVIGAAGLTVAENKLVIRDGRYQIDFADLERQAKQPKTTVMMLCNPMNPVGRVLSRDELAQIVDICQRHGVLLISDEVHSDLCHNDHRHIPLHMVNDAAKQNSIIISASGKTFNLASLFASFAIIADPHIRARYRSACERHHLELNAFSAVANAVAYRDCDYYIAGLRQYLGENLDLLENYLQTELPSVKLIRPEATYLAWLDFREWGMDCSQLQRLLRQHGVGLSLGSVFGGDSEGFMRMNFGCHRDTLTGALKALKQADQAR